MSQRPHAALPTSARVDAGAQALREGRRARRRTSRRSRGAPLKPLLRPADVAGTDSERDLGYPGQFPFTRGAVPDHVPRPAVDHAPVRRLRHRARDQRALQVPARARAGRALGGLRLPDADGLRLRPRRARGEVGRCGVAISLARGHGDAVRRHPAGRRHDVDDHQRPGADHLGDLHRDGARSRASTPSTAARHARRTTS